MNLLNKKISIVGLGYVGLPLAVAFAKKFQVVGYDIDESRIKELVDGNDKTLEVENSLLQEVKSNIEFTSNYENIEIVIFLLLLSRLRLIVKIGQI